jgi:hypothetical protein
LDNAVATNLHKRRILELYYRCKLNEATARPALLLSLLLGTAWLFAFSYIFVLWGYYDVPGLAGVILVELPVIALAHIPLVNTNPFDDYYKNYYITANIHKKLQ